MKTVHLSILFAAGWILFAAAQQAPRQRMNVQVRSGPLRDTPSFLGRVLETAQYGESVEVLATRAPWVQVRHKAKEGWMHQSALTSRRLTMQAGTGDMAVTASADEIALAGKGFNKQVEDEFRGRNKDLDFTWIDRAETFSISETEMREFLKDGKVLPVETEGSR